MPLASRDCLLPFPGSENTAMRLFCHHQLKNITERASPVLFFLHRVCDVARPLLVGIVLAEVWQRTCSTSHK